METPEYAAHVAVRAATYAIDKPYEYVIPQELLGDILPGLRVFNLVREIAEQTELYLIFILC